MFKISNERILLSDDNYLVVRFVYESEWRSRPREEFGVVSKSDWEALKAKDVCEDDDIYLIKRYDANYRRWICDYDKFVNRLLARIKKAGGLSSFVKAEEKLVLKGRALKKKYGKSVGALYIDAHEKPLSKKIEGLKDFGFLAKVYYAEFSNGVDYEGNSMSYWTNLVMLNKGSRWLAMEEGQAEKLLEALSL